MKYHYKTLSKFLIYPSFHLSLSHTNISLSIYLSIFVQKMYLYRNKSLFNGSFFKSFTGCCYYVKPHSKKKKKKISNIDEKILRVLLLLVAFFFKMHMTLLVFENFNFLFYFINLFSQKRLTYLL